MLYKVMDKMWVQFCKPVKVSCTGPKLERFDLYCFEYQNGKGWYDTILVFAETSSGDKIEFNSVEECKNWLNENIDNVEFRIYRDDYGVLVLNEE